MRPSRPAPNFQSMGVGRNSKLWTVREGKLASRTVFNDSHTIAHLMRYRRQWRRLGRRHCALRPRGNIVFGATFTTGAELPREALCTREPIFSTGRGILSARSSVL